MSGLVAAVGAGSASAVAQADLVLFVLDARAGVTPADEHFDATNQLVAPLVVQEVVGTEFKLLPGANQ